MTPRITTGSKNLDHILGGGLPSDSISLIAGPPGSGKSTLAHQILFANLKENMRAVYVTTLGEPVYKVLKNMQTYDFFDPLLAARSIYYEDAGLLLSKEGLKKFLDFVSYSLTHYSPEYFCIDGIDRLQSLSESPQHYESFLYELTGLFSAYHCNAFWLGTYTQSELLRDHIANACDHIVYLEISYQGERSLQVLKLARSMFIPGIHHYAINEQGIRVTPRFIPPTRSRKGPLHETLPWGLEPFDKILKDQLWKGEIVLVKGLPGTGKTSTGLHFLAGGVAKKEKGALLSFKEDLADLNRLALTFGWDLEKSVEKGEIAFLFQPPIEVNQDDLALRILQTVRSVSAQRVFINDLHHLLEAYNKKSWQLVQYVHALWQYFKISGLTVLLSCGYSNHEKLLEELCEGILLLSHEDGERHIQLVKGGEKATHHHTHTIKFDSILEKIDSTAGKGDS
jgi:circadian clock protein KaiC